MGKRDSDTDMEKDAELWARVTRTAAPLTKKNRVTHVVVPPRPPRQNAKAAALDAETKPPPKAPAKPSTKPPARPALSPTASGLDRQTARKLDKGRLMVEARLDLHGMRQRGTAWRRTP